MRRDGCRAGASGRTVHARLLPSPSSAPASPACRAPARSQRRGLRVTYSTRAAPRRTHEHPPRRGLAVRPWRPVFHRARPGIPGRGDALGGCRRGCAMAAPRCGASMRAAPGCRASSNASSGIPRMSAAGTWLATTLRCAPASTIGGSARKPRAGACTASARGTARGTTTTRWCWRCRRRRPRRCCARPRPAGGAGAASRMQALLGADAAVRRAARARLRCRLRQRGPAALDRARQQQAGPRRQRDWLLHASAEWSEAHLEQNAERVAAACWRPSATLAGRRRSLERAPLALCQH